MTGSLLCPLPRENPSTRRCLPRCRMEGRKCLRLARMHGIHRCRVFGETEGAWNEWLAEIDARQRHVSRWVPASPRSGTNAQLSLLLRRCARHAHAGVGLVCARASELVWAPALTRGLSQVWSGQERGLTVVHDPFLGNGTVVVFALAPSEPALVFDGEGRLDAATAKTIDEISGEFAAKFEADQLDVRDELDDFAQSVRGRPRAKNGAWAAGVMKWSMTSNSPVFRGLEHLECEEDADAVFVDAVIAGAHLAVRFDEHTSEAVKTDGIRQSRSVEGSTPSRPLIHAGLGGIESVTSSWRSAIIAWRSPFSHACT